ncbi:MAG: tetratricopeptide repeat protein, partial [Melioribacter sp.]|nr:tetratricopeptide repeat protein [Melioribacter sp.]
MISKRVFILVITVAFLSTTLGFQVTSKFKILFEKAKFTMETKGDLKTAITLFNEIIKKYPNEREYAARSQFYIGLCNEKLGNVEARKAYEIVLSKYADQPGIVNEARARLTLLESKTPSIGPTTRRILADAEKIGHGSTVISKYIRTVDGNTGDVFQFEITSGDTSRIKNNSNLKKNDIDNIETYIFSPDGEKLAYNIAIFDSVTNKWTYELHIRNLDGSDLHSLYNEKYDYIYPFDWSSDGRLILAAQTQNNVDELVLISLEDGSKRILKKIITGYIGLWITRFSPDGKYIALSSVKKSNTPNSDILIIDVENGNEVFVAEHPAEDQMLRWTPDGKNLVFLSDRSGTWDLWAVRVIEGKQLGEPQLIKKDFGYNVWNVIG